MTASLATADLLLRVPSILQLGCIRLIARARLLLQHMRVLLLTGHVVSVPLFAALVVDHELPPDDAAALPRHRLLHLLRARLGHPRQLLL